MINHPPKYRITHFDLSIKNQSFHLEHSDATGHYCVFWWKAVPLGHLFIEADKNPVTSLVDRAVNAIQPALTSYSLETGVSAQQTLRDFTDGNTDAFNSKMEAIFQQLENVPASTIPITVVVCTRNRAAVLAQCLASLQRQEFPPDEILVVDNAPVDESTLQCVSRFKNVRYIREDRPGLDIARNTGAYHASRDIIAYTDDDVILHPRWVYAVWETFSDENIEAVTGLVIASELNTESQVIFEKFWSFNRGYHEKRYDRDYFQKSTAKGPPVWEIGAGANMAFRKSAFQTVGYFDERLDVGAAGCSGDSEMWFRILAAGRDIFYNPRAVCFHQHRSGMKALEKQLYSYMRGHAAAALISQKQISTLGYKKHLRRLISHYYLKTLCKSALKFRFNAGTLLPEFRGLVSGIVFYYRNRSKPSVTDPRILQPLKKAHG